MRRSVFIVAIESSGDHLGAGLIRALREQDPKMNIRGIGGAVMDSVGVPSDFDISRLSIIGFTEGLRAYPHVLERVKAASKIIMESKPDAVVLIDSWGFMVRLAQQLTVSGYKGKIIKYVAPQVWAMRSGRAAVLAKHVDYLLSIQPMDKPFFDAVGLPNDYVGNPIFDTDYSAGDSAALRAEYNIPNDAPIIGVFFGSRLSELRALATPFAQTVERIKAARPDVYFVAPMAASIDEDILAAAGADLRLQDVILLPETRKLDVFAAIDLALACSGTVTTQLASVGVPSIVCYKLSRLTFFAAKRMFKPSHISIVNIAANKTLMPEFLQSDVNGETLSRALLERLDNEGLRQNEREALLAQIAEMKQSSSRKKSGTKKSGLASDQAASKLLAFLNA